MFFVALLLFNKVTEVNSQEFSCTEQGGLCLPKNSSKRECLLNIGRTGCEQRQTCCLKLKKSSDFIASKDQLGKSKFRSMKNKSEIKNDRNLQRRKRQTNITKGEKSNRKKVMEIDNEYLTRKKDILIDKNIGTSHEYIDETNYFRKKTDSKEKNRPVYISKFVTKKKLKKTTNINSENAREFRRITVSKDITKKSKKKKQNSSTWKSNGKRNRRKCSKTTKECKTAGGKCRSSRKRCAVELSKASCNTKRCRCCVQSSGQPCDIPLLESMPLLDKRMQETHHVLTRLKKILNEYHRRKISIDKSLGRATLSVLKTTKRHIKKVNVLSGSLSRRLERNLSKTCQGDHQKITKLQKGLKKDNRKLEEIETELSDERNHRGKMKARQILNKIITVTVYLQKVITSYEIVVEIVYIIITTTTTTTTTTTASTTTSTVSLTSSSPSTYISPTTTTIIQAPSTTTKIPQTPELSPSPPVTINSTRPTTAPTTAPTTTPTIKAPSTTPKITLTPELSPSPPATIISTRPTTPTRTTIKAPSSTTTIVSQTPELSPLPPPSTTTIKTETLKTTSIPDENPIITEDGEEQNTILTVTDIIYVYINYTLIYNYSFTFVYTYLYYPTTTTPMPIPLV
ncbi:hypothetical protein SK128_022055, partial [Halocaridina rubra]